MHRVCPNCAARVVYDISLGALSCNKCGSIFDVEEFDKNFGKPEDEEFFGTMDSPSLIEDDNLIKGVDKDLIDVSIFSCSSCGADIVVSKTESSTFCIYCGNPSIVFSRMKKINRPDCIIPFKIPKEKAEKSLRKSLNSSFFTPSSVKNFKTESMVGIYIPYHINNLYYSDTIVARYRDNGREDGTKSFTVKGSCLFDHITTDACTSLNNDLSYRVEPYDISEAVAFDEDYLLGFYSDIPDVSYDDAYKEACYKARETAKKCVLDMIDGKFKEIVKSDPKIGRGGEPLLSLMPMWFLTYKYDNIRYTAIVNGQTGKIVAGTPVDKKKVAILTALMTLPLFAIVFLLLMYFTVADIAVLMFAFPLAIASIVIGYRKFRAAELAQMRSMSSTTRSYAYTRQGGQ